MVAAGIPHLLGKTFWTAPPGCPWDVTPLGAAVPNFSGRGDDPALGALTRDSKFHPSRLSFTGYKVDEQGPEFHYRVASQDATATADIVERLATLHSVAGMGVARELSIAAPAGSLVWLRVAETDTAPQWIASGAESPLNAGDARAVTEGALRVQHDGQPILLRRENPGAPNNGPSSGRGTAGRSCCASRPRHPATSAMCSSNYARASDDRPDAWQRLLAEELK